MDKGVAKGSFNAYSLSALYLQFHKSDCIKHYENLCKNSFFVLKRCNANRSYTAINFKRETAKTDKRHANSLSDRVISKSLVLIC